MKAKPFLKWVGGKRSILPELISRQPKKYDTYYETFLGGGALYFELLPEKAVLSDINFHLITTFIAVRDEVENLIEKLRFYSSNNNKENYYKARERFSIETNEVEIAALMIYLNRACFNGLYRTNKSGKFNVPFANEKVEFNEENLLNCSKALQTAKISVSDFSKIDIVKNCFYYLDPPYHKTFTDYNEKGFNEKDQILLSEKCKEIHNAGGYFMLSNSDTELINSLYRDFIIDKVSARRSIARNKAVELIIKNY